MKNLYTWTCVFMAAPLVLLPPTARSQCMCSATVAATPMSQSISISQTKISSLTFSFQQFNPSIGNLSCVTLHDTITGISQTGARNTGPDSTAFKFLVNLTNDISGPGIDISDTYTSTHGIDTLAPYGQVGDTITYAPENIITNPTGIGNTGPKAAYIGLGTVPFVYTVNGGMITTKGGSNYRSGVDTWLGGNLTLTYYWCPAIPLASTITNFSAFRQNGVVDVQWMAADESAANTYEIQYSTNETDWKTAGSVPAGTAPAGTLSQYKYQYDPAANDAGIVYFRIRKVDAQGNISYSSVKSVNLGDADANGALVVYPNPVQGAAHLQFAQPQTGRFVLELISTAGQVLGTDRQQLDGAVTTTFVLPRKPAAGLYFLRARDEAGSRMFLTRVLVQ